MGLKASKIIDYIEKCFNKKLFKIKFPTKNTVDQIFISPRSGARGVQHLTCTGTEKLVYFMAEQCQKYRLYLKLLQWSEWVHRFVITMTYARNIP